MSAEWCLCFLIHCLGLSQLSFQGASVFYFHGCSHCPTYRYPPDTHQYLGLMMQCDVISGLWGLFPMYPSVLESLSSKLKVMEDIQNQVKTWDAQGVLCAHQAHFLNSSNQFISGPSVTITLSVQLFACTVQEGNVSSMETMREYLPGGHPPPLLPQRPAGRFCPWGSLLPSGQPAWKAGPERHKVLWGPALACHSPTRLPHPGHPPPSRCSLLAWGPAATSCPGIPLGRV